MKRSTPIRIRALDGWRGIAIAMVLFDHIQFVAKHRYLQPWLQTGKHGVTIFFVLSGFLITSNLIAAPIKLGRFYVRRFFRLMPTAWLFLAVLAILARMTHAPFTSREDLLSCLLFYRNYIVPARETLGAHFWSLSIEEQFYLIWPVVLLMAGPRICRWIAAGGALAVAFFASACGTTISTALS